MKEFALKWYGVVLFLAILVVIYFPIFLHLSYMPFCMWDESIIGVNAIEMAYNHNYLVTYFEGYPDMFRCKPPLSLWCVILSSKILGFNELSLRLPSAIAAAALCIYLFFTLKRITGNYLFGFFAVCILVTCQGYIGIHLTRTGDYDSLWILFSTVFSLSLYQAVEAEDKKTETSQLLLFFIFLTLGLLTKGIACMLQLLPGLLIYIIVRKKTVSILRSKGFYAGLIIFTVFGLGYYILRNSMNPGYIKAVLQNELGTRFGSSSQGQGAVLTYYLRRMLTSQFVSYMFIFPFALFAGLKLSEPGIKRLVVFAVIMCLTFFVLISLGPKKIAHYDAPMFPFIALITASFFYDVYGFIADKLNAHKLSATTSSLVAFLFILSLFGKPYFDIIKTVWSPHDSWDGGFNESCKFYQQIAKGKVDLKKYKLMYDATPGYGPDAVLTCYKEELAEQGMNLWFVRPEQLVIHDNVVILDSIDKQIVARDYQIDTLQHLDYCNADVVFVKGVKGKS